jgi:transposase
MSLARAAGVDWNVAQTLSDEELQVKLYKAALPRNSKQLLPDFAIVHLELKRAGVTLQLLWEEYAKDNALAYKYTTRRCRPLITAQGQLAIMLRRQPSWLHQQLAWLQP